MNSFRRPAKVLFVDENSDVRFLFLKNIEKQFPVELVETDSVEGATQLIGSRSFDVIIFGHSNWEEGVQLYCDVLNNQKPVPQFIMFMQDPSELEAEFEDYFAAVRKPDFDELIDAVDWFVYQSGNSN